jgi:hypothetical protein
MDAWLHWLDHAMGAHHHHAPVSEEAALRQRVQQLEAELAKAKAQMSPHAPPLRGSLNRTLPESASLGAVQTCAGTSGAAAPSPSGERFALGRPGGETVTG